MNRFGNKVVSLLLSLALLFTLVPSGFALESTGNPEEQTAQPSAEEGDSVVAEEEASEPETEAVPSEEESATTPTEPPVEEGSTEVPDQPEKEEDTDVPEEQPAPADSPEIPEPTEEDPQPELLPDAAVQSAEPSDVLASAELPEQETPPTSSASIYNTLTLEGTFDYDAAAQVLKQINSTLFSILSMDQKSQECAMTRAAELAVYYSNTTRPTGESWATVLGDAGSNATIYKEVIACGSGSAEEVAQGWIQDEETYRYLSNDSIRSVGIGCFYQEESDTMYWVLIITNQYTSPSTNTGADFGTVQVAYQPNQLGTASVQLSASSMEVGETGHFAKLAISNGKDFFYPAGEQITYSTDNDAILTVDGQGNLTLKAPGQAVLTATLKGTNCTAFATVTVTLTLDTVKLKGIANQTGAVYLTWNGVTGANAYQVWRKVSGGSWAKVGAPVTKLSYTDTSVSSNVTYTYTVRALYTTEDLFLQGDYDRTGLTIRYLAAPELGSAKSSSTGIAVEWKAVTGATSYSVYRKTIQTSWVRVANVSGTSYLDTNVTANTQYYYTVRAQAGSSQSYYNTAGISATATTTVKTVTYMARSAVNYYKDTSTSGKAAGQLPARSKVAVISGWSKQVNGTTWYMILVNNQQYYIQANYLLGTPTISSIRNASTGLQITWNRISSGNGYCLYQKDSAGKWVRIATLTSNSKTSWIVPDANLSSGTRYTFTVRATYGSVLGDYSTAGASGVYVKTPKLLSATSNGKDQITFTWEQIPKATGYIVYRKPATSNTWTRIAQINSGSTCSYADKTVTAMTSYKYTVRATVNGVLSYYFSGLTGMVIPTDKVVSYVVTSNTKYYTAPGTNNSSPGSLKAGTVVQVISGWSKQVNGVVWYQIKVGSGLYYIPSNVLLAAPKLGSIAASGNALKITWRKVSNATGYLVYRKTSTTNWVRIASLKASALSYTDDSLASGTTYFYTVKAQYNSVGSDYDRKGLSLRYLSTPKLTSIKASTSGITVGWTRVTGSSGYVVYRKVSGGSWAEIGKVTSGSTISYMDKQNLLKGVTYIYTVRAFSGSALSYYQTSGLSAKATATVNPTTKSYVTTGDLNYRDAPGMDGRVVGTFSKGTTVQVIPSGTVKVDGSTWYMIYYKNNCYYASAKWLKAK